MREVLARQTRREGLTSRGDVGNIGSQPIEEMRKHEEPESIRIKALMLAYASAVWAAYKEADDANTLFWVNLSGLASAQIETQLRAEQESAGVSEGSLRQEADYQGALDAITTLGKTRWWSTRPCSMPSTRSWPGRRSESRLPPTSPVSGSSAEPELVQHGRPGRRTVMFEPDGISWDRLRHAVSGEGVFTGQHD